MRATPPDLVILDLRLPDVPGEFVATEVRRHGSVPLLMLTAKAGEQDRVRGLQLGADDYVTKPFSPAEVVLRVQAILRRRVPSNVASFGEGQLVLDDERRLAVVRGDAVVLTATEWGILRALAGSGGRVLSRYELCTQVRGFEFDGHERMIDSHMKNLRRKVELDPASPVIVQTVVGAGYRLGLRPDADIRPRNLFGRLALGFVAIAVVAVGMSSLLVLVIVTRDVHQAADKEERQVAATVAGAAGRAYVEGGRGPPPTSAWPSPWAWPARPVSGWRTAGGAAVAVPEQGPGARPGAASVPGWSMGGTWERPPLLRPRRPASALDDLRQAIPSVVGAGAALGALSPPVPRLFSRRMAPPMISMAGVARDIASGRWDRRVGADRGRPGAGRPGHQPRSDGRCPARTRGRPPGDGGRRRPRAADARHRAAGVPGGHGQRGLPVLPRPGVVAPRPRPAPVADGRGPGGAGRGGRDPALPGPLQTVDLGAVVARSADDLRPQFEAAGIDLRVEVEAVDVAGDAHRLHQVTSNLLTNALSSRRPGSG